MIRSKWSKKGLYVECNGCPAQLLSELLLVTNTVISALSQHCPDDDDASVTVIDGADGDKYDAELLDSIGSLLMSAITNRTSPVWSGIFN